MLGLVAAMALVLGLIGERESSRRERCLSIADNHARLGAEYRRNAEGDPVRSKIAAWHEFLSRGFKEAADRPWAEVPVSRPLPPEGWAAR